MKKFLKFEEAGNRHACGDDKHSWSRDWRLPPRDPSRLRRRLGLGWRRLRGFRSPPDSPEIALCDCVASLGPGGGTDHFRRQQRSFAWMTMALSACLFDNLKLWSLIDSTETTLFITNDRIQPCARFRRMRYGFFAIDIASCFIWRTKTAPFSKNVAAGSSAGSSQPPTKTRPYPITGTT